MSKKRFQTQLLLWVGISFVLAASFPVYNLLMGRPLLGSDQLSLFDIVQTTALIYLIYTINNQRQKIDRAEKLLKDFHSSVSIELSKK